MILWFQPLNVEHDFPLRLLACAGHLLLDLPLCGAPVFVLGGSLTWTMLHARRSSADSIAEAPGR
jgi:hypothetical protein